MDFKNVEVCRKTNTVSVNGREIKTAQDLRDFLSAPTNLIESFTKNRAQKSRAGKKPKRPQAIFEFVELMYSEFPELSGSRIFRLIKITYPEQNPYPVHLYHH